MTDEQRRKEMEAQIEKVAAEIRKLKAEADKAGADARARMHEEIRKLEAQEDEARDRMRKLREAGGGALEDMMSGAEKAWKALADSVEQARKRFR